MLPLHGDQQTYKGSSETASQRTRCWEPAAPSANRKRPKRHPEAGGTQTAQASLQRNTRPRAETQGRRWGRHVAPQQGPAQRGETRQLSCIRCPGAARATCRDGFPLPPPGGRPGQQAYSRPDGLRLGLPAPRACTEAVRPGRPVPGRLPPRPAGSRWAGASTLLPRGGGQGEASTGLRPPPRARLHTSPSARLKDPVRKLRRGCLTVKEFQRPISGSCQGAPTPRGEALAGWASPRSTLSSQL